LEGVDLKKNAKVEYYLDRYADVKREKDKEEKKNSCYLNSDQFRTIFTECIEENRANKRERK
jgi:hypothetical protein